MVAVLQLREQHAGCLPCPYCGCELVGASPDWWRCSAERCAYELTTAAHALYGALSEALEKDPDGFFESVRTYRDEVRALEPAWQKQEARA
ncbi:hypothetical protein ACGFWI_01400 [Streptomyces sp. NPDC048434]|uniref:hypothetical protein n=1 Tax=Streptomyces sp. NPDC048434 TaxID=3365549 RepID=UPI003722F52F